MGQYEPRAISGRLVLSISRPSTLACYAGRPRRIISGEASLSSFPLWLKFFFVWSGGPRFGGLHETELDDRDLPHPELLDLPRHRHRELGREPHVPGDLVAGDLPAA